MKYDKFLLQLQLFTSWIGTFFTAAKTNMVLFYQTDPYNLLHSKKDCSMLSKLKYGTTVF